MAFKMKNASMAKMVKEAGNNRVSPMSKKVKFREDTRSSDYVGDGKDGGSTTSDDAVSDYNIRERGIERGAEAGFGSTDNLTSVKDKAKTDDNLRTTVDGKLRAKSGRVNVKIKGKKNKSTIADPNSPGASVKDVKKVKMTRGSGKMKVATKVKYDKEGNVKKETVRDGRLGLKKKPKGANVGQATVGTKEGKDLKGAAAAEAIVKKQGSNIRGRKRKFGSDEK